MNILFDQITLPQKSNKLEIWFIGDVPPPAPDLIYDIDFGSYIEYDLTTQPAVSSDSYFGANLEYVLNTVSTLSYDVNFGSDLTYTLTTFPRQSLIQNAYFGAALEYTLSIETKISSDVHFGSDLEYALTVFPRTPISSDFEFGAYLDYDLRFDRIGIGSYIHFGAELEYNLEFSQVPFTFDLYFGSNLEWLEKGASPYFRQFDIFFGANLTSTNRTDFNLSSDLCCRNNGTNIDFGDDQLYDPNVDNFSALSMSYNITHRTSLSYDCYFGSDLERIIIPDFIPDMAFGAGLTYDLQSSKINLNLCDDNFIQSSRNVVIDFGSEYGKCETINGWFGASLVYGLSPSYGLGRDLYFGSVLDYTLDENPYKPFIQNVYFGSNLTYDLITISNLHPNVYFGANLTYEFYQPPWDFEFGANLEYDLKIEYNIEFEDNDCLPNEYLPLDEDGFVDYDRVRVVPIELDHYVHVIKPVCRN